jgi:membrane protein YqaA with SNARE-associated domain
MQKPSLSHPSVAGNSDKHCKNTQQSHIIGTAVVTNESLGKRKYFAVGLLVVTVGGSVAVAVLLIYNSEYVIRLENQGYLGLFLISLLAGSPIPIPTPSMILTFTLGSLLNPVWVGIVSGLGNAIGYGLVYLTGRGGFRFFPNFHVSDSRIGRFLRKIKMARMLDSPNRTGMVAIFVLSIYPNPVLTPLVLGMGATRFSFTKFFLACWAGKTVMTMILAFFGYFGLRSLLHFLGIFHIP